MEKKEEEPQIYPEVKINNNLKWWEVILNIIFNQWNIRIVSRVLLVLIFLFLMFFLVAIFYGFYMNTYQGRSYKLFGLEYGEKKIDIKATCDFQVTEALASILTHEISTPGPSTEAVYVTRNDFTETLETENSETETVVAVEPTESISMPFDFNDGYIWSEWNILTHHHLKSKIDPYACNYDGLETTCNNLEYFGYTANKDVGLNIYKTDYDGTDTLSFGMSRRVPDSLRSVTIDLEWEVLEFSPLTDESVEFRFGFINFDKGLETLSYFRIYNHPSLAHPYIWREDGSNSDNYIGFTNTRITDNKAGAKGYLTVTCDILSRLDVKCDFNIDRDPSRKVEDKSFNVVENWDSLYIGSELPVGASINLTVTNLSLDY